MEKVAQLQFSIIRYGWHNPDLVKDVEMRRLAMKYVAMRPIKIACSS